MCVRAWFPYEGEYIFVKQMLQMMTTTATKSTLRGKQGEYYRHKKLEEQMVLSNIMNENFGKKKSNSRYQKLSFAFSMFWSSFCYLRNQLCETFALFGSVHRWLLQGIGVE